MAIIRFNGEEYYSCGTEPTKRIDGTYDPRQYRDLDRNSIDVGGPIVGAVKKEPAIQYGPRNRKKWWHR